MNTPIKEPIIIFSIRCIFCFMGILLINMIISLFTSTYKIMNVLTK